jgi:hypothetical protein
LYCVKHRPLRETMRDMWQTLAFEPSIASIVDDTVEYTTGLRQASSPVSETMLFPYAMVMEI